MNYSLHIPRPSLTGSTTSTRSGSSSLHSYSESNYNLPITATNGIHSSSSKNLLINSQDNQYNNNNNNNKEIISIEYKNERNSISSSSISSLDNDRKNQQLLNNKNNKENKKYKNERFNKSMDDRFNYNTNNEYDIGQLKRGSRSSQGSTDSHHSTGTASSGSLLLTTANLERFVAIHNNNSNNKNTNYNNTKVNRDAAAINVITATTNKMTDQYSKTNNNNDKLNIYTISNNNNNNSNSNINNEQNDNTMLEIDPNLHFIKTKDVDAVSIASSTHFTMVNGVGGPQRKTKNNGICSRGHQLTVLILTMSGFFLIGILLMVYLMEMRAREMPQM
ncbi:putative uncharacterized protein DDB_G0282133 [Condylostylus longicornis]|uniref:putative uncharacterized protein DDB_G0282133 n=1 Tax=Condylostylus longicornis TaxID=2530218 RepID=UPI00244E1167|nr:putative uncharacterized protein DDB_G0282133 [Condylostylus longicornis]